MSTTYPTSTVTVTLQVAVSSGRRFRKVGSGSWIIVNDQGILHYEDTPRTAISATVTILTAQYEIEPEKSVEITASQFDEAWDVTIAWDMDPRARDRLKAYLGLVPGK